GADAGAAPAGAPRPVSLRRIFALFRPHRRLAAAIVALALAGSLLSLVPPLLFKSMIDAAIPAKDAKLLLMLGAGAAAVTVLSGLLDVGQHHLENVAGQRIMRDLRLTAYANLLRQSMSFFTRSRSGELQQRLTGDIQMIQSVVARSVVTAITQSTIWLTSIIVLLALDWKLALLALLLLPLCIVPSRKAAKIRKRLSAESQAVKTDLSAHIAETTGISGALLTRLYGRERLQADKYAELNDRTMRLDIKMNVIGRWVMMLNGAMPSVGTIFIYVYGGFGAMQGTMTVGAIVAFTVYLNRLFGPTQQLLNLHMDMVASLAVFERIFEYQDMRPDATMAGGGEPLPPVRGRIVFNGVSYRASPESELLRGVSFEVRPGELAAIVGPSGAGKSTLLGMLARLHDPSAGTIEIDGRDIRDVSADSLRAQLAFVTQQTHLFHASVRDNLTFAKPDASAEQMEDACRKASILDYIRSLPDGFDTVVGERGYRLSGGEQQRLSIARALLKQPRILILDEATSHLDSRSEAAVQAALEQVGRHCTTLVVAHRLSTVASADKIVVLDEGTVAEIGTHDELLRRNGLYASLYRAQSRSLNG
ncbi:ABC transporter ATP-binding protein, partial [Paenibacillus sp. GYB003]|uniref:ABC transporter ATP-binding protein n=1 Tax=Paenibacillus sp. GYB003 TaxID=2994392 RepID=UPI002F966675